MTLTRSKCVRLDAEALETRDAPATLVNPTTVVYTDVDGDAVTVRTTKGSFDLASNFLFADTDPGPAVREQLQRLTVADLEFEGASLTVAAFRDPLKGGDGDTAIGGDGIDSLTGGLQDDRLIGGNDNDTLQGNAGHDELFGCHVGFAGEIGNPNDSIVGGAGNDSLYGGDGDDCMEGQHGGDYVRGDGGNDMMYGGFDDPTFETGLANGWTATR